MPSKPATTEPNAPAPETPPALPACPTNQKVGSRLDALTLKALLAVPLTVVAPNAAYRFCPAPDCPTVYYRADGQQLFDEADLRERVFQKHADDPDSLVCYCFGYRVGDIQAELEHGSAGSIVAQIEAGIQAGQCACDIRNPQGRCCLGNVRRLKERILDSSTHTETHDV